MKAVIKDFGALHIPDPIYGDMSLNVFPLGFAKLPKQFECWEDTINQIMKFIPWQTGTSNEHYVTIDTKFFTKPETLRREGVHIDGNFCADPNFRHRTWGGTQTTWAGAKMDQLEIETDWVSPYNVQIPVGEYVSDGLGGIFCVSSEVGCQAWRGQYSGNVGDQGDCSELKNELHDYNKVLFEKHKLYFMTSNTPHESLLIDKGVRRTFIRITLAHDYNNKLILN